MLPPPGADRRPRTSTHRVPGTTPSRSPSEAARVRVARSRRRPARLPEGHPLFGGVLPPAIGPVAETLKGNDLVLVVGSSVFPYYPYIPGPLLPDGAELVQITSDPDEAARAPMGDAIVADVALTLRALVQAVDEANRAEPTRCPTRCPARRATDDPDDGPQHPRRCLPRRRDRRARVPSSTLALRNQLRISRPGSYYFGAGGGLGFGLAASIGVQLAQPDRPVVCVLGEDRRSTRSLGSGPRWPTRSRSPSSCCNPSTRS